MMRVVEYEVDGRQVDTETFERHPDQYIGLITCIECKKKAWYTKSYQYKDTIRAACFNAHHVEGCEKATSVLVADGEAGEPSEEGPSAKSAEILINLDKTKHNSMEVSSPADKHGGEAHTWPGTSESLPSTQRPSDFPDTRSLRQILSYLVKNAAYGAGKHIRIIADSGREVLNGDLHAYLTNIASMTADDLQTERLFWGEINNYTEQKDGSVWLNVGSYQEPSLLIDKELKEGIMHVYHLSSLERFKGAHFIMVGWAGTSKTGKYILRTALPKYVNFINYRERIR
ncbi:MULTISPECIES: hypothetical protein [unclassified Vibrio]|uniref:hypothetical protein n=1 Tax=unclassified Vibrio TaxID=2614977 RepID=UPI001F421E3C|nr:MULTISPECIES: hypothetical protein [unclassified Vibrio]